MSLMRCKGSGGCATIFLALSLTAAAFNHNDARAGEATRSIELVLSNLPPSSSRNYKSLRKLSGQVTGQTLTQTLDMTRSEVWRVPANRSDDLIAAATAKGVVVIRLDSVWNHALAPLGDTGPMTSEQQHMLSKSMDSKAAMSMSMMSLPPDSVMEYALTKDMTGSSRGDPPAMLVIPLNANTAIKARRITIKSTGKAFVWRGEVEDTGEAVTLMWWPDGRLTGTVNYKGHIYAIKNLGGTMHGVVEMNPEALPAEHAPMSREQMQKMNMRDDPLVKQGDASMLKGATPVPADGIGDERGDLRNLEDAPLNRTARGFAVTPWTRTHVKPLPKMKPVTITLLVAYTRQAAAHYTNIATDMIELAVEEANQSMINSGIGHVRFEVVHTHETAYVESGSHFDHIYQLQQPADGVMDEIPKIRNSVKADVAVVVVHDPKGCGLAAKVAAEADRAFAVVHHECAATTFSLAHEVGHLIGARHDLALDDSDEPFPHGHGFVNGNEWRTMMSYKESCDGCPRLPVWSNPDVKIKGVRAGDAKSNNARVIAEQAARVAAFR